MATTEFLAFATGGSADVISQSAYAAAAFRTGGFSAGIADPSELNKVWRQGAVVAAALTQAVADLTGLNIVDDGDLATLVARIKAAIAAGSGVPSFNGRAGAITLALADVNSAMTGKLALHSDPTSALHAATKQYVDSIATGIQPKTAAALATTASVTLSGEQTIDGTLTSASRVLVKNQSAAEQNGVYTTAAGAWSRVTDMDAWSEVPGALVYVTGGTANAGRRYYCTSAAGGTLNTTAITFVLYDTIPNYTASGGVDLSGSNFRLTDMPEGRVKGRAAGAGTGAPTDLTGLQLAALLDLIDIESSVATFGATGSFQIGPFIIKWGVANITDDSYTTTFFPTAFPTACLAAFANPRYAGAIGAGQSLSAWASAWTSSTVTIGQSVNTGSAATTAGYIAIGH